MFERFRRQSQPVPTLESPRQPTSVDERLGEIVDLIVEPDRHLRILYHIQCGRFDRFFDELGTTPDEVKELITAWHAQRNLIPEL